MAVVGSVGGYLRLKAQPGMGTIMRAAQSRHRAIDFGAIIKLHTGFGGENRQRQAVFGRADGGGMKPFLALLARDRE